MLIAKHWANKNENRIRFNYLLIIAFAFRNVDNIESIYNNEWSEEKRIVKYKRRPRTHAI